MEPDQVQVGEADREAVWRTRDTVSRQADHDVRALRKMFRDLRALYEQEIRAINVACGHHARNALTDVAIDKLRVGLTLLTDDKMRKRRAEAVDFLARCTRGTLDTVKAHDALVGAMDDEQLGIVQRREFLACLQTLTPEEWALVDEVRATVQRDGQRAGAILGRRFLTLERQRAGTSKPVGRSPHAPAPTPEPDDTDEENA